MYLYKSGLVHRPYFYLSESISQDRIVYYGKLDSSRKSDYNEWIVFFLRKIAAQARLQIDYINVLDNLYEKTRTIVSDSVNSPKFDAIMETLFKQPILTSKALSERLSVSVGQAKRYLEVLEKNMSFSEVTADGISFTTSWNSWRRCAFSDFCLGGIVGAM